MHLLVEDNFANASRQFRGAQIIVRFESREYFTLRDSKRNTPVVLTIIVVFGVIY